MKDARGEEKGDVAGQEGGPRGSRARDAGDRAWAQELLDHLRPTGRDIRRLVAWLAETVNGTASLHDDTGTLVAGSGMPLDETLIADIRAGMRATDDAGNPVPVTITVSE